MENCSICYEEKPLIVLHDNCKFCAECTFNWLKTLANNNKNVNIDTAVACPTQTCSGLKPIMLISGNLPSTYKDQLNDIFFRNYLMKKSDIIQCSNPSCEYAGMSTASHFGCRVPFHCESCGQDWTHPIVGGTSDKKWPRFKTYITKTLSTKRCPYCQTYITKAGGCDIVTCTACNKAFSWGSVFHPGLLILFLLIFIPTFTLVCCYYRRMLDRAKIDNGMKVGLWVIHFFLLHTFIYMFIRYFNVACNFLGKTKCCALQLILLVLILAAPIAVLIGLNKLLPSYYSYWLQIVAYDCLFFIVSICVGFILVLFLSCLSALTKKSPARIEPAPMNVRAIENGNDLEAQRQQEQPIAPISSNTN